MLRVDAAPERGSSVIAQCLLRTSGGRAGNVAVMARRLHTPARLFGCVGTDDLADQALTGPRSAGVDFAAFRRVPLDTGLATILVDQAGTKTMIFAPGANDGFSNADGERLAAEVHGASPGSVLVVDTEVSPAALLPALQAVRESGRTSVLDPTRTDRVTDELLGLADHVTPNADEAARITGVRVDSPADARRAAWLLRQRGARHVYVRLREGGCLVLWPEGEALLRVRAAVTVVDTTGAGDAFAGTLATAMIARDPPVAAARRAVAAAACAVSRLGAQDPYPDRRALEAMAENIEATSPRRRPLQGRNRS